MAVDLRSNCYSERGGWSVNTNEISKAITELKTDPDYVWLADVPANMINQSLRDSDTAFTNFFKGQAKYPKFKARKHQKSCRFQMDQRILNYIPNEMFKLPKLGNLKIKWPSNIKGRPKMATVTEDPSGSFWLSFMTEQEHEPHKSTGKSVGIDVGISKLIATSDGDIAILPEEIKNLEAKIAREQRKQRRQTKGSGRWHRQRKLIARIHRKITRKRNDLLHKISSALVEEYDIICVETLNIKGMTKNRKLARAILRCAWGRFLEMLAYKCEWNNKQLVKIDRWFPSTKMCSSCGTIHKLKLSDRTMDCACGNNIDRDENAALNIRAEGIRLLTQGGVGQCTAGAFGHHIQVNPMNCQLDTKQSVQDALTV